MVLNRSDSRVGLSLRARGAGGAVPDRRAHPVQPRGARLDQQGHAHHAGQPRAPGEPGHPRFAQQRLIRARPAAPPGRAAERTGSRAQEAAA